MRFAIGFVMEKGEPVGRPMWVTAGPRTKNYGSYSGIDYLVTGQPEQATTYANRATAERWAEKMSSETYGFEAVEAPEGSAA